jgi:hypothetical protein
MANAARGEVAVRLAGAERTLCLTLGALAAMEAGLGVAGTAALAERLRRLSAGDLRVVLQALAPEIDADAVSPREAAEAVAAVFAASA